MSTSYPSNLSDAEWICLQHHLPAMPKRGRPPTHVAREPSLMRSSLCCARAAPGATLQPTSRAFQTVFSHFRRLRLKGTWFRRLPTLREAERERVGRNAQPSAAIIDATYASKRLRNPPGSVALMRTSMSKAGSATSL